MGGPSNSTGQILDFLNAAHVSAIFFFRGCSAGEGVLGSYMRRAFNEGHMVGLYGCTGKPFSLVS